MTQPDLLSWVPHNGTDTSRAAADSLTTTYVSATEARVRDFIRHRGDATCDEVEVGTGLPHQNASARINKLVEKGLIKDSGERRPTRSGRKARVYVVCG